MTVHKLENQNTRVKSKAVTTFKYDGNFFDLDFSVDHLGGCGNSGYPVTLKLRADQSDQGDLVFNFVGEQEFMEFREAIELLAQCLKSMGE